MVFGWWFREQLSLELVVLLEGVNVVHTTLWIAPVASVSFRFPPSRERTIISHASRHTQLKLVRFE